MPARFIIDGSTIRETRDPERDDSELPTRPRKRQRTDSGIDAGGYSDNGQCLTGVVEDDPEFFRVDGDCVVRVANMRFKVRGSLLANASPVLEDILARHLQGSLSDCAIVLIADPDEFRALCWALYASPQALAEPLQDHDSVSRFLLLAAIARQFRCTTLSTSANAALLNTISNSFFADSCSSSLFSRLVDTAIRTHHTALLSVTLAAWTARLRTGSAPCVPAIVAADLHELAGLRGIAYYFHVQTMLAESGTTQRGATVFQTAQLAKLNNGQVMRLLSGHWSLVSLCEQLRRSPVAFPCACDRAGGCTKVCVERWGVVARSERVTGIRAAALLTLLSTMQQLLVADVELKTSMCAECRVLAIEALTKRARELEDGLADHFFGCL
ncbi:hypothetical protein C8F01DRAFT_1015139 [Mycena amicta]|nr:hypothetical protein C8F01DRAFT_1015139 [Mycena amicta]